MERNLSSWSEGSIHCAISAVAPESLQFLQLLSHWQGGNGECFFLLYFSFLSNLLGWHWLTKLQDSRSTILQHIICTLNCVFTTTSQIPFHHHLPPFTTTTPPTLLPWQSPHSCPCPWVFTFLLLFSIHTPHPTPNQWGLFKCMILLHWTSHWK